MAFIDRVVGPDETLIGIVSVHWIYVLKGALWFLGLFFAGQLLRGWCVDLALQFPDVAANDGILIIGNSIFWIAATIGAVMCLFYVIMYLTTELGLTTKRVIYKRGWLMVDTSESDLEDIKAADVDNGVFGRILNYGYLRLDARFVDNVLLPAIADPYRFVKAMNETRSQLHNDSAAPVIDDHEAQPRPQPQNPENVPEEYLPPNIQDERYHALENNPAQAGANMMADAPPREPEDQVVQREHQKKKVRKVLQQTIEQSSGGDGFRTSRPILFKRNMANRKAELSRRVRSIFSRKSKARA